MSRTPKVSSWCARSTPSWSGSRTNTSPGGHDRQNGRTNLGISTRTALRPRARCPTTPRLTAVPPMWAHPCPSAHLMAVLEPDAFESARRLPLVASVAGLTWLARIALDRAFGVGLRTADWLAAWPALVRALDGIA